MPVWHNKEKDEWCVGSRCVYKTKKDAEKSWEAIRAKKYSEENIEVSLYKFIREELLKCTE